MKSIIYFIENQGVNYSVIWSDCSIVVCLVLIIALIWLYWSQKKQAEKANMNYHIKAIHNQMKLYDKIYVLEEEKKALISRAEKAERKRNEKGQFLSISGKGHGKKRQIA